MSAALVVAFAPSIPAFAAEGDNDPAEIVSTEGDGTNPVNANAIDISTATVTGIYAAYLYTGQEITPAPVVTVDSQELVQGTNYTVAYENNVDYGTAKVTISGYGDYKGTKELNFRIVSEEGQKFIADGVAYDDLLTAVYYSNGATVKMLVDAEAPYLFSTGDISIDLNGHNIQITGADGNYAGIYADTGNVEITGEGTITTASNYSSVVYVSGSEAGNVNIGKDVALVGENGILVWNDAVNATVNMDGTIQANTFGITVNGLQKNKETYPTINVTGTINAGASGVYGAGYAAYNLNGTITGTDTGAEIRAGILNVTGGTITGGTQATVCNSNTGGSTTAGAGIAIVQHTTGLGIQANVQAGTIKGATGIYVADPESKGAEGVSLAVGAGAKFEAETPIADTLGIGAETALSIDEIADQTFTGSAIEPTVVVRDGGTVVENATVTYENNTSAGLATVTAVSGEGDDTKVATATFRINPVNIESLAGQFKLDDKYVFTGNPIAAVADEVATNWESGYVLKNRTDYTVSYENNTDTGKATATIRAYGANFEGSFTKTFKIVDPMAVVGEKSYASLSVAINEANGQPVRLLQDATLSSTNFDEDNLANLTIDLNGHNLEVVTMGSVNEPAINVEGAANLTITGTGTVSNKDNASIAVIGSTTGAEASITIGKDVTIIGKNAIYVAADATETTVDFAGTAIGADNGIVMEAGELNVATTANFQASKQAVAAGADATVNLPEGTTLVKTDDGTFALMGSLKSYNVYANGNVYNGEPQAAEVTLEPKDAEMTLIPAASSYEITYLVDGAWTTTAPTERGTYTCKLVGRGDFKGQESDEFEYSIAAKAIDGFTVTLEKTSYEFTGSPIEPEVTVSGLPADATYNVIYRNNTSVGTARAIVILTGDNYAIAESPSVTFQITGTEVAIPTAAEGLVYNGEEKTAVQSGTGYGFYGAINATDAGNYVAVAYLTNSGFQWADGTTGEKRIAWTIAPQQVEGLSIEAIAEQTYAGVPVRPNVTVNGLPEGAEYLVEYANNNAAGTATVTVTLQGNYAGSATAEFTINAPAAVEEPTVQPITIDDEQTALAGAGFTGTQVAGSGDSLAEYTYDANEGGVWYKKSRVAKKAKKVAVPATVKIQGVTYKVIGIAKSAFSPAKKTVKKITVGKNVKKVSTKAFAGLKKVKKLTLGANIISVGKKAFQKSSIKTLTIKSKKLTSKKSVNQMLKGSKVKTVKTKSKKVKKAIKKYAKGAKGIKIK